MNDSAEVIESRSSQDRADGLGHTRCPCRASRCSSLPARLCGSLRRSCSEPAGGRLAASRKLRMTPMWRVTSPRSPPRERLHHDDPGVGQPTSQGRTGLIRIHAADFAAVQDHAAATVQQRRALDLPVGPADHAALKRWYAAVSGRPSAAA